MECCTYRMQIYFQFANFVLFLQLFEEYFSPYFVSERYAVADYFWTDVNVNVNVNVNRGFI